MNGKRRSIGDNASIQKHALTERSLNQGRLVSQSRLGREGSRSAVTDPKCHFLVAYIPSTAGIFCGKYTVTAPPTVNPGMAGESPAAAM